MSVLEFEHTDTLQSILGSKGKHELDNKLISAIARDAGCSSTTTFDKTHLNLNF